MAKFVSFSSYSISQRFATVEEANKFALEKINAMYKDGYALSNMSIHEDYSYSNKNTELPPMVIGYTATISGSQGRRYIDGLVDEVATL